MSLTLRDVEVLALAIAHVHRHPEPESYAQGVRDAWHQLTSDVESKPAADAPPAPPAPPAPQTSDEIAAAALAEAAKNQAV